MKNWKIGKRITAGFGVLIAIAMALGVFAYSQIGRINKSSFDVSGNALPSVELMGQVHSNTHYMLSLILQHIISTDKEQMAALDAEIRALRTSNGQALAHYEKELITNDEDRRLSGALNAARTDFWICADELLQVSRLGTVEGNKKALAMYRTQLKPLHVKYLDAADKEGAFNHDYGALCARLVEETVGSARIGRRRSRPAPWIA